MSRFQYDDPVYRNTRREAISILVLWGLCFAWVIPYCHFFGYERTGPESLQTVLGMPSWVFWGVALPWIAASLAGLAMCMWWIQEDDLGEADEFASGEESNSGVPNPPSIRDASPRSGNE